MLLTALLDRMSTKQFSINPAIDFDFCILIHKIPHTKKSHYVTNENVDNVEMRRLMVIFIDFSRNLYVFPMHRRAIAEINANSTMSCNLNSFSRTL